MKQKHDRGPSKTVEHETPEDVFHRYDDQYRFTVDPCTRVQHHTAQHILKEGGKIIVPSDEPNMERILLNEHIFVDGLNTKWTDAEGKPGIVWLNPPYGRVLGQWVEKAYKEVKEGNALAVVALLPARTGVKWWQEFVCTQAGQKGEDYWGVATKVEFLRGRLTFGGETAPAMFPSVVVIWV